MSSSQQSQQPSKQNNHYEVLKVSHTATQEEIKSAYRSLIKGCHPDKLQTITKNDEQDSSNTVHKVSEGLSAIDIDGDDEEHEDEDDMNNESTNYDINETNMCNNNYTSESADQPIKSNAKDVEDISSTQHTNAFHQIQAAYNCLRDPIKRRQYDEYLSRNEEREEWKWKGAIEVNLSEMECDWCCVVDEEDDSNTEKEDDDENGTSRGGDETLQKVFFHPCRCGDTFQVVREEIVESIKDVKFSVNEIVLTNRVWQCDSCSLKIQIHVDMKIDT